MRGTDTMLEQLAKLSANLGAKLGGMPRNAEQMHECHSLIVLQVRQTAVSYDASTILACCEDGTVWRWDSTAALAPSDGEASAREEDEESSHASMQDSDEME